MRLWCYRRNDVEVLLGIIDRYTQEEDKEEVAEKSNVTVETRKREFT